MAHDVMTIAPHRVCVAALALAATAAVGFGLASPDFSQLRHPVALLGASGEPHAFAFNLLAFVAPGLMLAWAAMALRGRMRDACWPARIGLQLAMLSALAFAAQGALPLDPYNLLAPASRLHALAWTLWWVAFVPGALLSAAGDRGMRVAGVLIGFAVPAVALLGAYVMPAPVAQRIAFVLWFAWWLHAARRVAERGLPR